MKIVHDKVINLNDGEDHLNTKLYADTLYNIVTEYDDEDPITIGIYGGWGTGKSSIVKTLESEIEVNNPNDYGIFIYDAWKYSQDSLRRSLFLALNEKFKVFKLSALKSLIYEDQNQDTKVKYKLSWAHIIIMGGTLLTTFVAYNVLSFVLPDQRLAEGVRDFGLLTVFFELMMFILQNTIVQYRSSVHKSKLFSPEQFENLFSMMIGSLTGATTKTKEYFKKIVSWISDSSKLEEADILQISGIRNYKKIVIVIDNIDRCEPEVAKEVLLTIKNFLSIKNSIFIVPIADKSITAILDKNIDDNDKDEFLRKYFNLIVRIQAYGLKDTKILVEKIMQKYSLSFDSELLIDIVRFKFGDTPRRIVQFFNNFQVELELAKLKEERNLVPNGSLTKNVDLLAVISIIKDNWGKAYAYLCDDPRSLYLIAVELQNNKTFEEVNKLLNLVDNNKLPDGLLQFIQRNLLIILNKNIKNWDPFFRITDFDATMPDNLRVAISSGNFKDIQEIIEKDNSLELQSIIDKCIEIFNGNDGPSTKIDKSNALNIIASFYSDSNYRKQIDEVKLKKITSGITNLSELEIAQIVNSVNLSNIVTLSMFVHGNGSTRLFNAIGSQFSIEADNKDFKNEDQFIELATKSLDQGIDILKEKFAVQYFKTLFTQHPLTIINHKNVLDRIEDSDLSQIIPLGIYEEMKQIEHPNSGNDLNYILAEYLISKKLVKQQALNSTVEHISAVHSTHLTSTPAEDSQVLHLLNHIARSDSYDIYDEDLLKSLTNYQSKITGLWSKEMLDDEELNMIGLYLNTIVEALLKFGIKEDLMDILRLSISPYVKDIRMKIEANNILTRLIKENKDAFNWKVSTPLSQSFIEKRADEMLSKSIIEIIRSIAEKLKNTSVNADSLLSVEEVRLTISLIISYNNTYETAENSKIVSDLVKTFRTKFEEQVVETLSADIVDVENPNLSIIKNIDNDSQISTIGRILEKNIDNLEKLEKTLKDVISLDLDADVVSAIQEKLNELTGSLPDEIKIQYYSQIVEHQFVNKGLVQSIFNYCIPIINDSKKGIDAIPYLNMLEGILENLSKEETKKLKGDLEYMKENAVKEDAIEEIVAKAEEILSKIKETSKV